MKIINPNTDIGEYCNAPNLDNYTDVLDYFPIIDNRYAEVSDVAVASGNQTCINHDNLIRCWYTYIPESAKTSTDPVPIVIDLHGNGGCAVLHALYSGWASIAEKQGFIMVWPSGNIDASRTDAQCWEAGECCCSYESIFDDSIDDTGFLRQVISNTVDSASDKVAIDTKRIYFAGHSNGCVMSQTMAALASDLVAAVCCHSGFPAFSEDDMSSDYQPTPILNIHGDLDAVAPYDKWMLLSITMTGDVENAVDAFEFWGDINGCKQKVTTVDSSKLYATHSYLDCIDNATVKLVQVFNAGHTPYLGVDMSLMPGEIPENITTVDTTQLAWDFCSPYQSEFTPSLPEPVPYVSPYILKSDGSYLKVNVIPCVLMLVYFMFKL